jgi:asparagine synthase (glutamine-hydrolysing)
MKTYLPDDILAKVDRASMAVSLEVRAPMLDHHFLELTTKIPSSLKLRGKCGKYIFKKAMADVLPQDILHRRKQGFAVPLARWFRDELRDLAHDAIFSRNDGVLNAPYLRKIWDQHQSGTYDRSSHLWSVLMYREWYEKFQT